ncbi:MAG: hypothetical protein ACM3NH_00380 [Candidatus Saccharibacteria bacterium]
MITRKNKSVLMWLCMVCPPVFGSYGIAKYYADLIDYPGGWYWFLPLMAYVSATLVLTTMGGFIYFDGDRDWSEGPNTLLAAGLLVYPPLAALLARAGQDWLPGQVAWFLAGSAIALPNLAVLLALVYGGRSAFDSWNRRREAKQYRLNQSV